MHTTTISPRGDFALQKNIFSKNENGRRTRPTPRAVVLSPLSLTKKAIGYAKITDGRLRNLARWHEEKILGAELINLASRMGRVLCQFVVEGTDISWKNNFEGRTKSLMNNNSMTFGAASLFSDSRMASAPLRIVIPDAFETDLLHWKKSKLKNEVSWFSSKTL